MKDDVKEAVKALAGFAAARMPTTTDAFVPLMGVRFSLGDGEALQALMNDLKEEATLTDAQRDRIMDIVSYAETALDGGEVLVIGYVREQLEAQKATLESREANFVQQLASACWGIPTKTDEPMPRETRASSVSQTAPKIDPSTLPSLGATVVQRSSPPAAAASASPDPQPAPAQETAETESAPAPSRFVKMVQTGPDDPKWVKLRTEYLDPLFARRERAEEAGDLDEMRRADEDLAWVDAIMLNACIQEFIIRYGRDNLSRMNWYIILRKNGSHRRDPAEFEQDYGPIALML